MNIEQKPGDIPNPEYPFKIRDVADRTGVTIATVHGEFNRNPHIGLASSDDSKGHILLSQKAYDLLVEGINARKEIGFTKPPIGKRIHLKPSGIRRSRETPTRTPREKIILPNGDIIPNKKNSKTKTIIGEVLRAQKAKETYTESELVAKGIDTFYTPNHWIGFVTRKANEILKPHHYEFTSYETEAGGKKTRAFRVTEIKEEKSTSSAEQKSLKG